MPRRSIPLSSTATTAVPHQRDPVSRPPRFLTKSRNRCAMTGPRKSGQSNARRQPASEGNAFSECDGQPKKAPLLARLPKSVILPSRQLGTERQITTSDCGLFCLLENRRRRLGVCRHVSWSIKADVFQGL